MRVPTGEEGDTRGHTYRRCHVVLMKQTAFARELIQVWGLDQRIAATCNVSYRCWSVYTTMMFGFSDIALLPWHMVGITRLPGSSAS
jgi:hypothetical protein